MRRLRDLVRAGAVLVALVAGSGCTTTPELDAGGCTAGRLRLQGLDRARPGLPQTAIVGTSVRAEASDLGRRCRKDGSSARAGTDGLRLDVVQGTVRQRIAELEPSRGTATQQFAVPSVLVAGPVDVVVTTANGDVIASQQFELVRGAE